MSKIVLAPSSIQQISNKVVKPSNVQSSNIPEFSGINTVVEQVQAQAPVKTEKKRKTSTKPRAVSKNSSKNFDNILEIAFKYMNDIDSFINEIQEIVPKTSKFKKVVKALKPEVIYKNSRKSTIKEMYPHFKTTDVNKLISEEWGKLDNNSKNVYIEHSKQLVFNFYKAIEETGRSPQIGYIFNPYTGNEIKDGSGRLIQDIKKLHNEYINGPSSETPVDTNVLNNNMVPNIILHNNQELYDEEEDNEEEVEEVENVELE